MGDHPADFHRARFSQLKPQLLVERSGGNVLRSRIKPYRFAGMLPRSFHRILDERGADAFPCGFRAYHDQMNDHHLLARLGQSIVSYSSGWFLSTMILPNMSPFSS